MAVAPNTPPTSFCKKLRLEVFSSIFFSPWWHQPQKKAKDYKRQYHESRGHQKPLASDQFDFISGKAVETFRKELAANHNIPSHCKYADKNEGAVHPIDEASLLFRGFINLQ